MAVTLAEGNSLQNVMNRIGKTNAMSNVSNRTHGNIANSCQNMVRVICKIQIKY